MIRVKISPEVSYGTSAPVPSTSAELSGAEMPWVRSRAVAVPLNRFSV